MFAGAVDTLKKTVGYVILIDVDLEQKKNDSDNNEDKAL